MLKSIVERARAARAAELEGAEATEGGFTLIELMVVLLIIAILLAIAIPTFLGVTGNANDRAAQSNLTNGLTEAEALYQNNQQSYAGLTAANFTADAPEFKWTAGACTAAMKTNCVSFQAVDLTNKGDGLGLILADYSKSGGCWYLVNLNGTPAQPNGAAPDFKSGNANATSGGTFYAHKNPAPAAGCDATAAGTMNGWNWGTSYSDAAGGN
jgi:type IV pilus assembly protein PilA